MSEQFQLADDSALAYETHARLFMAPFVDALVGVAHFKPGVSLLDVACGTGFVARRAKAIAGNLQIVGVDANEGMLRVAAKSGPDITWKQAPADALPFDDGMFDFVFCQQGFQFFLNATDVAVE